eukprot:849900-Amphidinium_carterae.1
MLLLALCFLLVRLHPITPSPWRAERSVRLWLELQPALRTKQRLHQEGSGKKQKEDWQHDCRHNTSAFQNSDSPLPTLFCIAASREDRNTLISSCQQPSVHPLGAPLHELERIKQRACALYSAGMADPPKDTPVTPILAGSITPGLWAHTLVSNQNPHATMRITKFKSQ